MVVPDFNAFRQMAEEANVVPVYREILGDLETPVSAYKKLRGAGPFLSPGERGGRRKMGALQLSGAQPVPDVSGARDRQVTLNRRGAIEEPLEAGRGPFRAPAPPAAGLPAVAAPGLPRFWGGLVGYLGYDMVRFIERLPELTPPPPCPRPG